MDKKLRHYKFESSSDRQAIRAERRKQINVFHREREKAQEYGEVMLWHRSLDVTLTEAIKSRFAPSTAAASGHLLKYPGGLSSFSARVHLARCMGLFGPITYADLKIINDIRNNFAHPRQDNKSEVEVMEFGNEWFIKSTQKLEFINVTRIANEVTRRVVGAKRYIWTCGFIMSCLEHCHIDDTKVHPSVTYRLEYQNEWLP
jgi:hypothetical protein